MKITALVENTALSDNFEAEHGLSLYIETKRHKILFDSGQTDMILRNAHKLNVNLSEIDTAIISHGHYDHSGGMESFLVKNNTAKIFLNKNCLGDFYSNPERYIGVKKDVFKGDRFTFTTDYCRIDDELLLYTFNKNERPFKSQSNGLLMKTGNEFVQDTFEHEQYLVINQDDKKYLISGCSHKGILNILNFTKNMNINYFVGGLHISKVVLDSEGKKILSDMATKLMGYKCKYYVCHCTGTGQFEFLKTIMKDQIDYLPCGQQIKI